MASNTLRLQKPKRDLIPRETFFELAGVQPEDLGLPVATIWDEGKPIAEGLLIRASGDNWPEG